MGDKTVENDIEKLTLEQKKELNKTGYVFIDGERYKAELCLEMKIIDKDGNIREV